MKSNEKLKITGDYGIEEGPYDIKKDPSRGRTLLKKQLAKRLNISPRTLYKWLNRFYYEDIVPLGYKKGGKVLNPKVVNFFIIGWIARDL